MNKLLRTPTTINLEITDLCNVQCRHCYNFWRKSGEASHSMTKERIDRLMEVFVDAGIFHIIFTGGEPFLNFEVLKYGLKKALENNMSVSCNSNLMLATDEKIKQLRDIGLDHILTSLNSYDPETNDYICNRRGAFGKIVKGIETTVKHGVRVSVNMIISQRNNNHVYETGKLASRLGCQKIFGTRVVPSVNTENVSQSEFTLAKNDALHTLNQLVRVKDETGIMIGSLVSYPLCLLSDLERFADFVGRGCAGQSGHPMSINSNGNTHACVHQGENYGNIFEIGIHEAYKNMIKWHDKSYRYEGCDGCDYIDVCRTGCRMSAHAYFGKYNEKDQLMVGKDNFIKPYKIVYDKNVYNKIDEGLKFQVPKRLRFRKEDGFYLVNIRWANVISVNDNIAEFLIRCQRSGEYFDINDFGSENRETLARLFFKDVIESDQVIYDDLRSKTGFSIDLTDLN